MDKDPEKDVISVVGIGDMSGDVFGNGMLLSKSISLVAAFNHIHIFIDPTPSQLKAGKNVNDYLNLQVHLGKIIKAYQLAAAFLTVLQKK